MYVHYNWEKGEFLISSKYFKYYSCIQPEFERCLHILLFMLKGRTKIVFNANQIKIKHWDYSASEEMGYLNYVQRASLEKPCQCFHGEDEVGSVSHDCY